jgi:co-chaperonin GroES (HSP10)
MNEREQELREQERESTMQAANANKGMIEVERYAGANFDVDTDYAINKLLFDTMLVHFEDGDADNKLKGGIFVPTGVTEGAKVFRVGKVLIAGTGCKQVKTGDYVMFPNEKGLNAKSVNVKGVGVVKHCIFIAEDRLFGICEKV